MILLGALCLSLVSRMACTGTTYKNYQVLRLLPNTDQQFRWVNDLRKNGSYDFWSRSDVMVAPDQVEHLTKELDSEGFAWKTLIPDVQATLDAKTPSEILYKKAGEDISFTQYYRYDDIVSYLMKLQTRIPDIVKVSEIEKSFEGRPLILIKISRGGNSTRPIILIDAGMHAREWIAPAMALFIIHQLVDNSSNADLLAKADWHIIPVLNPDGYEYSHTHERLWRKTRSKHKCPYMVDPYQGVDINRNFGFHWMENGGSNSSCTMVYAGPVPFSERETCALRDHALANAPRVKLYISLHSGSRGIIFPWSYTSKPSNNEKELIDLARAANDTIVAHGAPPFEIVRAYDVYPNSGTSHDFIKGELGVSLCYTIEIVGDDPMPHVQDPSNIPKIASGLFPAVRVMGEYINKM